MSEFTTSNGVKFVVDDEDDYLVMPWAWNVAQGRGYVRRRDAKTDTTVMLHNVILPPEKGLVVDHIDRNPLNNRYDNLRLVTIAEQNQNRTFRGVTKTPYGWWARRQVNGVRRDLGYYATEEEAIAAYKKACR